MLVTTHANCQQTEISSELSGQLFNAEGLTELHLPNSVKRFYIENGFQPVWIKSQDETGHTWQAMLMLSCVVEFGLTPLDYHPDKLSQDTLFTMLNSPEKFGSGVKARYEIVLTDAMLTFINHLHYGKLNPEYTSQRIDKFENLPFRANEMLLQALDVEDLMSAVADVQPKNKLYQDLQSYLHLAKGQYLDDCYELPEADLRLAAINMERLRWADLKDEFHLHVNIPTYTLDVHQSDSIHSYKVIVGRRQTQTPIFSSSITHFSTAPDWLVPKNIFVKELLPKAVQQPDYLETHHYKVYDQQGNRIEADKSMLREISKNPAGYSMRQSSGPNSALGAVVFRFPNRFNVYLHDTPEKKLFSRDKRAFSHGCIRVEKALDLAALLLQYDGASDKIQQMRENAALYHKSDFKLTKPVPIKVTYITCTFKDGQVVRYDDIYGLDKDLEMKLFKK